MSDKINPMHRVRGLRVSEDLEIRLIGGPMDGHVIAIPEHAKDYLYQHMLADGKIAEYDLPSGKFRRLFIRVPNLARKPTNGLLT